MSVFLNKCWTGTFDAKVIIIESRKKFEGKMWNGGKVISGKCTKPFSRKFYNDAPPDDIDFVFIYFIW